MHRWRDPLCRATGDAHPSRSPHLTAFFHTNRWSLDWNSSNTDRFDICQHYTRLSTAIFVRFSYSMAKPCMHIIYDDSGDKPIASRQSPSALPLQSGPSISPVLGRAVASSSHCEPMVPKELLLARSRPIANPPKMHSSQKRADPNPIKNDPKR